MVDASTTPATQKQDHKTAKIWDRFANSYSKQPIADEEAYQKKLEVTRTYMDKSMSVVEIGCGTGGTALSHAPFVKNYLATDISPKMIDIAKSKANDDTSNVEFQVASIDSLDQTLAKQSQDMVLGLSILHLLPDREVEMHKVHSWLKPGGLFVTSTVCPGDMGWMTQSLFKTILPVGSFFGLLPTVRAVTKDELKQNFTNTGFSIVHEWQPNKDAAIFIIGKKNE